MRADFWLTIAQNPRASLKKLVAGLRNIADLITDMVDAAAWVFIKKALDRAGFSQRIKQFNLGVRQRDKYHSDAMLRLILGGSNLSPQGAAILLCSAF